jgi:hypothetical protein
MTGKIEPQSRRWIDAEIMLWRDPKATVACPQCGQGTLRVTDARVDPISLDRYMQCSVCHARNVLSGYEPVQAIKLFVVSDRQLSSVTEWQAAIDGECYPLQLDGSKLTAGFNGFVPARLRDVETGFECDSRPRTDADQARKRQSSRDCRADRARHADVGVAAARYAEQLIRD